MSSESGEKRLTRRQVLERAAAGGVVVTAGGLLAGPATAAKPKRGGTFRVASGGGGGATDTLDPIHTVGTNPDLARIQNLYDQLIDYTPQGTLGNVLAEEIHSNPAATEWTVRLKKGVEFHNGKTLGADDLIFTVRALLDPKSPGILAAGFQPVDRNGMKKLDAQTVRFRLKHPVSFFEALWPTTVWIVPVGFDPKKPIGTGPFKYKSFKPGEQSVFERFENYWGDGPYFDELVIIDVADDAARVNALLSGQVDAMDSVPYSQVQVLERAPGTKVLISETGRFLPLAMRVDKAPYSDVRVRQALRLVVDRPAMVKQALNGYGSVANDVTGRFDPCYNRGLPQRHQDIERAKSLLAKAGHKDLTVDVYTAPLSQGLVESVQVFAQQAKAANVKVNIHRMEYNSFIQGYARWPFSTDYIPYPTYLTAAQQLLAPGGFLNQTHFDDPEYNRIFAQASRTLSKSRRCQLVKELQRIEYERGGNIVWGWVKVVDAYKSKVQGLRPHRSGLPLGNYRFNGVSFA